MNVFLSADIEGIGGVMASIHQEPGNPGYKLACEWMTGEVNAAVEGALQAGAERVVVKDSHNTGTNIDLDKLHPAAELISGWGPLRSMVEGIDETFDALFLIGYHARGMTLGGTLAHTWSSHVLDFQINGQPIGEGAWAAAFAGHFNVPVALITGDDKLIAQVTQELPAGFLHVQTKTGMAFHAARMRPIPVVRQEIRQTAAKALANVRSLQPYRPALPVTITLRFRHWEGLDACAAVPTVERLSIDTFQFRSTNFIEAQKAFATLHRLARPT
jgi:D-amino peptidase